MTFNPSPWASVKWTEAEENRLWSLRAIYGNCTWGEFAKLGFFPGRSTGAISRKYYALRDESSEARTRQPASILSRTTLCGRASAKRFMEPNLVIPDPRPQKRPTLRDENGQYPAIHTDRPREITATSVNRSASSRNTMFPTRTETAYPVENGNMTDPEASDDPGDIEFDGSTRRLHRGRRSQGTNGSPSRRSQITASPSQSPSTRPPPISHPARWCWESSSPSPRHRQRHPSPAMKVQEVDDFESSGNANSETVHTPENAHTISQVLDRFLEIDSSDGRACLPPDPAVHAQPARISFQLPASSANSSGPKRVMTSIPVYRNSLEELTSASNPNPVKPSHTPAFTTPNPSPPETTAEKLNKEPRTVANIEQPTSRRPAGNTRCLIDAAEKVVQCARFLDHDNESRTR
ncbi:hypothetical protein ASPCAL02256 [Aspergillus calidoustus]|uniref:Myb-like domain-containing protein n=1 Tax=Aspergillus calidoustus TaxID=454130 RepID=A0A0U5GRZ2_ASPCI|nr:hypothetical protein ASPCAL02256 [Aspergillus calidoustus]